MISILTFIINLSIIKKEKLEWANVLLKYEHVNFFPSKEIIFIIPRLYLGQKDICIYNIIWLYCLIWFIWKDIWILCWCATILAGQLFHCNYPIFCQKKFNFWNLYIFCNLHHICVGLFQQSIEYFAICNCSENHYCHK